MTEKRKEYVRTSLVYVLWSIFPDAVERENVVDKIMDDVIADIEATADENFWYSDVDIALSRVLYKKIVG